MSIPIQRSLSPIPQYEQTAITVNSFYSKSLYVFQRVKQTLAATFQILTRHWFAAFSLNHFGKSSSYSLTVKVLSAITFFVLCLLISIFNFICLPYIGLRYIVSQCKKQKQQEPESFQLPHYPSKLEIICKCLKNPLAHYSQQLQQQLHAPVSPSLDNLNEQKCQNIYQEVLEATPIRHWKDISFDLYTFIRDLPLPIKEETGRVNLGYTWVRMLNTLNRSYSMEDHHSFIMMHKTMQLLVKTLESSSFSPSKKLEILNYVASYHDKCSATYIRALTQELQALYNQQNTATGLILKLVQQYKRNLLELICSDQTEWHFISAFIIHHGEQIGLDNEGVVSDFYTSEIVEAPEMRVIYRQYLNIFLEAYKNNPDNLIEFVLDRLNSCSDEELSALNNLVIKDLENSKVPANVIADVMSEIFFPEENDYQPSRDLVIYLLLRSNVLVSHCSPK